MRTPPYNRRHGTFFAASARVPVYSQKVTRNDCARKKAFYPNSSGFEVVSKYYRIRGDHILVMMVGHPGWGRQNRESNPQENLEDLEREFTWRTER